jgi:hypothetical protein
MRVEDLGIHIAISSSNDVYHLIIIDLNGRDRISQTCREQSLEQDSGVRTYVRLANRNTRHSSDHGVVYGENFERLLQLMY